MRPKHRQKKRVRAYILTAVLSTVAVMLAILFVLTWMLFSDPHAGLPMPQPSEAALSKLIPASISGKEVSLTSEEVGSLLNNWIQQTGTSESTGLTELAVLANKDGTVDVYAPVRFRDKTFGVLMNIVPSYDNTKQEIQFDVQSVQVGRLSIPVDMALDFMESKLPSILFRRGNTLVCSTESLFGVSYSGISAQLRMTELTLQDQIFTVKFQAKLGLAGGIIP